MFPGFEHLWSLEDPLGDRPYRATLTSKVDPIELLRAERRVPSLQADHAQGEPVPGDVVWTDDGNIVLFSGALCERLRDAGLTGWHTIPAHVAGAEQPHGFLVITGRCGPIAFTRSSREAAVFPGGRRQILRGWFFDEQSWDGSDFFMESNPTGSTFVTQNVVAVFREHSIRNVAFVRMDELEIDPCLIERADQAT